MYASPRGARTTTRPVDLREAGTKNPGALNAAKILGARWGLTVLAGDVSKGALACIAGRRISGGDGAYVAGIGAVVGHCAPLWSGFRGGKGVATSAGTSINDSARTEGAEGGQIVVVTDAKFKVVGAHILAPGAGDMIGQFTLAIANGQRLTPDFGNLVQVYPTITTAFSQVAAEATYGQLSRPFLQTVRKVYGRFR